jgi:PTS system ascorbate-specific IIB component
MKILAVCGTGLGSSFMVEMNIKSVLKELNAEGIEVEHSDLGAAVPGAADFFIAGRDIAMGMKHLDNVIELNNLLDKKELKEKIEKALQEKGTL